MDMPKMKQNIRTELNAKCNTTRQTPYHHRKHYAKKEKWHEWTEEEKITRGRRLRTLQKHNPWSDKEERTAEEEKINKNLTKHLKKTEQQQTQNNTKTNQTNTTNIWGGIRIHHKHPRENKSREPN